MRVLWLANTPVGASEYFNHTKTWGGWMSSLETRIKELEGLKLGVCFFYNESEEFSFEHKSVSYYPVKTRNNSLVGKITSKLLNRLDDSNTAHLLKVIEDFKPDLIQLFGTESGLGEVLRHVKIPHIIHIQGLINPCLSAWFPKGMSQKTIVSGSSIKSRLLKKGVIGEYYKFKKMAVREEEILRHAKNIFGRTDWDKRTVSLYNKKIRYFHCNELLRSPFFEARWEARNSSTLSLVSTIIPNIYKGLEIVLKTSYILKEKAKINFKWTIIGMTEDDPLVNIFQRIEKKRFKENNVVFAGYHNSEELIEKLTSSDLFVHPSHIDNSPNSVCEAMLLGMPVIAGKVGGVPSIIEDKHNGLLYNSHDPYELAAFISQEDSEGFKRLGQNARKTAIKRHHAPTIIDTIQTTYKQLISESN